MLRVASTTTRVLTSVVVLLGVLLVTGALAGCGSDPEDTTEVEEGLPMKLGDLVYNVQISRFLNSGDDEDRAYLVGQAEPPSDKLYLAVFMTVENEADTAQTLPTDFEVTDTTGAVFKPVPAKSQFALPLGGTVPANQTLPEAESTAANAPIQGAMVLFLITDQAIENRPLILEIPSSTGPAGEVTLDI
jgi:hypothetical protein